MSAVSEQFLDQGFDGAEPDEAPASTEAKDEPKADDAKADEADGKTDAETKGETSKTAETPTADADKVEDEDDLQVDEQRRVPLKVALVERKKRQELERRLAERDGELKALRPSGKADQDGSDKTAPKQLTPDDAHVDPAGYTRQEVEKVRNEERSRRYGASERRAQKEFGADMQKYIDAFNEWAASNKQLYAQMDADDDPVVFAATQGRRYLKTKDMGDPEEFEAKIRADERTKIEAERKRQESLATAKTTPKSTVSATGAADDSEADDEEVDEPENFKSILKGRGKRK